MANINLYRFYYMAKSKNGGTRTYLRGRIGSDVYSIGKTSKGKKQQVVRSLAEEVSNPRTQSQMFGRMIMSTVMQAVSALKPIIDHSFDGFPVGQPSISEFIRRNYALVKADAVAHPASSNTFGLNQYGEKGVKGGLYIVSDGNVIVPASLYLNKSSLDVDLPSGNFTVGGFREATNIGADGYLTWVGIKSNGTAVYGRVHIKAGVSDETTVDASSIATIFEQEGSITLTISYNDGTVTIGSGLTTDLLAGSGIISKKVDGAWKHSKCVLLGAGNFDYNADAALPSYPVGVEQFLNGGDI